MSLATKRFSSPAKWTGPLESRNVLTDHLHEELVGADVDLAASDGNYVVDIELVGGTVRDWPLSDSAGALQDVELVGDDGQAQYERDVVRMSERSGDPGRTRPPSYSRVSRSATRIIDSRTADEAIRHFRDRLRRRDPRAVKALHQMVARARAGSRVDQALARMIARGHAQVGAVVISGTAHSAVAKALGLVLTPASWAVRSVGKLSTGVGNALEKLAGKL